MSEYLILHFKIPEDQSVELTSIISNEVIDIYHSTTKSNNDTKYKDCTKYSFDGTEITKVMDGTPVDISIETDSSATSAVAASTP